MVLLHFFKPGTTDGLKIAIFVCVSNLGKCHRPKHSGLTLLENNSCQIIYHSENYVSSPTCSVSNDLKQKRIFLIHQFGKTFLSKLMKSVSLINDIEYEGLKMLDLLESMILSQKTMCLNRYIEDYTSP